MCRINWLVCRIKYRFLCLIFALALSAALAQAIKKQWAQPVIFSWDRGPPIPDPPNTQKWDPATPVHNDLHNQSRNLKIHHLRHKIILCSRNR